MHWNSDQNCASIDKILPLEKKLVLAIEKDALDIKSAPARNNLAIKIFLQFQFYQRQKHGSINQLEHPIDKWFFEHKEAENISLRSSLIKVNSYFQSCVHNISQEHHCLIIQLRSQHFPSFMGKCANIWEPATSPWPGYLDICRMKAGATERELGVWHSLDRIGAAVSTASTFLVC